MGFSLSRIPSVKRGVVVVLTETTFMVVIVKGMVVVYEVDGNTFPVGGRVHPSLPLYKGVIAQTQVGTDFLFIPLACCL